MKEIVYNVQQKFRQQFGEPDLLVFAPGRVNLIGEHTDYNEGFVLPAAIDKGIVMALKKNDLQKGRLYSIDKKESHLVELSKGLVKSKKEWANYMVGVVDQLLKHEYNFKGFDCVFGGNLPIGAGLSSSAALTNGVIYGLTVLYNLTLTPVKMARLSQKAENEFVGVQCGIMDQFASLKGEKDHVIRIDCRSLDFTRYPFKTEDHDIVLCDTQVHRELASSEYNARRKQCFEGVHHLQKHDPSIESLRDVSLEMLEAHKNGMEPVIYSRCQYVLEENQRVLQACGDLEEHDYASFGQRMYASHNGLRDLYEVSCRELDTLVDITRKMDGVTGARMMGGGFGGCTINLVKKEALSFFKEQVATLYKEKMNQEIKLYQISISDGTHVVNPATVYDS